MKRVSLATFALNLVVIGSIPAIENQQVAQNNEQSQSDVLELRQTTNPADSPSAEQAIEKISLDPIIAQAISFSNKIGDWFEDLFDKKQHMSFNAHVDKLEKIVDAMQAAIIKPLAPEKNRDAIALAAYNLTSILYARAQKTYDTLDMQRSNPGFMKISNALKKIDKNFRSEQEKTKLSKAFKELIAQLNSSDAVLCKKVTQLELVVAENSTRTKQKGWWALAWGLRHRLKCT